MISASDIYVNSAPTISNEDIYEANYISYLKLGFTINQGTDNEAIS